MKCFRIRGPLHVRVSGSRLVEAGIVYVPLKLVLRYLVVTRMKKQTATSVFHERLNATGTWLLDPGIRIWILYRKIALHNGAR